jgi:CheY-like chemotaxis protein
MADRIRVLVVDEDSDVLELAEMFLEREAERLDVETETSAAAAAERIGDGDVDCVVSDYRMPGMDGIELLERVREAGADLPFFLTSATVDDEAVAAAEAAGAAGFVRKGSGSDHYADLAARIREAVG